jgi:hypothetical protein
VKPITRTVPLDGPLRTANLRLRLNCLNNESVDGHPAYSLKLVKIEASETADGWVAVETWEKA